MTESNDDKNFPLSNLPSDLQFDASRDGVEAALKSRGKNEIGFDVHVFICTNTKPNGKGCAPLGSEKLRKNLKDRFKNLPDGRSVRVNASGCLGQCEQGIACVKYPAGEWKLNVQPSDEEMLAGWIAGSE